MRILHVSHEFPPYEFAGTAIYAYNIVKAQSADHDLFVFSRLSDEHAPDYKIIDEDRNGYQVRLMNRPEVGWDPFDASYTDPRAERLLTDYVDEVQPDLVHFHHLLGLSHTCIEEVKKRGIAVVMTLHDFWTMCPMGQRMCYTDNSLCEEIDFNKCGPCVFGGNWSFDEEPIAESKSASDLTFQDYYQHRFRFTPGVLGRRPRALGWAAWRTMGSMLGNPSELPTPDVLSKHPFAIRMRRMAHQLSQCDLLITPSSFLRDEFIRLMDIPPDKIVHSLNGMKFDHVVAHERTPSDSIRFGFVGSIIPTKGPHVLVEAARILKDRSGFQVDIYGAPNQWTREYNDNLIESAKDLDAVKFHGRFDNKQIGKVLAGLDVLVVPSIWYENAPLTLNEAAMTKTPVLASDRGGMLEFVRDNKYGRTFKLGDAEDLAQEMARLMDNPDEIPRLAGSDVYIKPVADNAVELEGIYKRILAGRLQRSET